jgi:predicted MFS family arabinose efflux permease
MSESSSTDRPRPTPAAVAGRAARGAKLSHRTSFWLLAATLCLLLFASSAPSPMYVVYQTEWNFSTITLTSVFAVYAIALLASLVIAGSVSDHVGRRPTLVFALGVELVGMLLFAGAQGVVWLFAARIVQGLATGIAMGTISASLIDLEPEERPRLGATLGVAAPLAGLALGALAAGLLVEYGPDPTRLVFWLLAGAFALAIVVALAVPETVHRTGPWAHSLKPRLSIPPAVRGDFLRAIPCLIATWALGGLILSLGPSVTAGVLGDTSHVIGALPIFIMAGISAIASVRLREVHPKATAQGGLTALALGVALTLVSIAENSTGLFLLSTAIVGLGFGPAFGGAFRTLSSQAPADQRAGLVSSILAVAYLAFSLPAVAAGAAVTPLGLRQTTEMYGAVLIAVALIALVLSRQLQGPPSVAAPQDSPATT